jgi:hypothetical protein
MKYVRLRFNEKEYSQLKKRANSANMRINRYIQEEVLHKKSQPYYFYNLIIVLLEAIAEDIKNNNYNENTSKIFFYLYLIEQILQEKL